MSLLFKIFIHVYISTMSVPDSSLSTPPQPPHISPQTSCPSFIIHSLLSLSPVVAHTHGQGLIYRDMNLPLTTLLKKSDSFSFLRHQLPKAPPTGGTLRAPPFCRPDLTGLVLSTMYKYPLLLWVHVCNNHAIPIQYCTAFWLLHSFHSFFYDVIILFWTILSTLSSSSSS